MPLVRAATGLASAIAPERTGRRAFDLFATPPAPRDLDGFGERVARARALLETGRREDLPFAGEAIATWTFEPPDRAGDAPPAPTVVLVHGWTSRAAFMAAFVGPLVASGHRVVAVDLPAHGESGGRHLHLGIAVDALLAVHARTGPWRGIVAHSFGGAVATALADGTVGGRPPVALERLALLAAPESVPAIFAGFGRTVGLGARAQAAMDARVDEIAGRPLGDFRGAAMLGRLRLPTLVVHAPDDREVDFDEALALAAAGDFVRLERVEGAGHRRILYDPRAVDAVAAFFGDGRPGTSAQGPADASAEAAAGTFAKASASDPPPPSAGGTG